MIEPIMYFGIGFLVACTASVWSSSRLCIARAVRLTMRRLEAATPLSMAEIQADKDQLRAEFAMSTRRLEMSVEQMKAKTTSQLAELGKKSDAINRLKLELGEKTADALRARSERQSSSREELRATEEELSTTNSTPCRRPSARWRKARPISPSSPPTSTSDPLTVDSQRVETRRAARPRSRSLKERSDRELRQGRRGDRTSA